MKSKIYRVPEWLYRIEAGYTLSETPSDPEIEEEFKEEEQSEEEQETEEEENQAFEEARYAAAYAMEYEIEAELARCTEEPPAPAPPNAATMPYSAFLLTSYWAELSAMLKAAVDWKCERCGQCPERRSTGLHVHHKTYAHRGREYPDHLNDLEVL